MDTKRSSSGFLSSSSTHTHDNVSDSNVVGATINGNSVTMAAGHDLTAQAAQVTATQGIALSAGHDVNLSAGQSVHTEEHDYSKTSSSAINTSATRFGSIDPEQRGNKHTQSIEQTTSVGTLLSGDTVTVAAGHDLTATAAQVAATHDVVLAAGNNLTLAAGKDTYNETDTSSKSHTGLMNGGGLSVMIGNQSLGTTYVDNEVSYTGSLVGSTNGRVTMSAGNDVHITDGTVLSQTGTTIVGKNVTIDAAVGTSDITQTQKQSSAGIHVGLSGGAANVANGVAGSAQAAHQSSDKRVQALYAAQAAQALFSTGGGSGTSGAQAIGDAAKGNTQDISLRIGLGASSATSTQTTHDDTAYGSSIRSNGDVTIAATGGDLNVIGSQINGNNVTLAAANNLNLLSQAEQHSDKSDSHNSSGEVGFSIGQTTGIYLSVNAGQAQGHGNGITHAESGVTAGDTLTLISGNDTTIRGAQAKGNEVLADIGGNLNIASEQDTNDYAAHSVQAGLTLVYGFSGGGAGVSGSLSASKTKSDYASVNQVSGIGAGDGGFQIHVGGNTDLHGAVIASSADPSKNLLDTSTLSFSDIENKASYSSESISVGGGMGSGVNNGISGGIGVPQNGSESSTTHAGIAEGAIVTRNGATDLTGLDRKPTLDDQALKPIFDAQKVQDNQQVGALAGQVGMTAVGDIASYMQRHATTEQEQQSWSDGGSNKVILHGLVGAATAALGGGNAAGGALGAGASEAASGAMQQYLVDNGYTPGSTAFNAMMQLGSAAIGGVGGGSGASAALSGQVYNEQLHPALVHHLMDMASTYAAEQCSCTPTPAQITDAQNQLIATAYRSTDDQYEMIAEIQKTPANQSAGDFLALHPYGGMVDGQPVSFLSPEAAQRADSSVNAYALYNDPQALAAVQQATGLYNNQMFYSAAATDYDSHPQWSADYAQYQIKQSDNAIYRTVGGSMLWGATGGLGAATAPWVLGVTAGTRVGSIAEFLLTTRTGVGLTNGVVNTASQLAQQDAQHPFKATNVVFGFATGYAGVGGGMGWNVAVNIAAGAANAQVNNWVYTGSNDSVIGSAVTNGIAGGSGYLTGAWVGSRGEIGRYQYLLPVVSGNVAGAGIGEVVSAILNYEPKPNSETKKE